jgi:glycosyltransferase involved in cell wall biosynthesis
VERKGRLGFVPARYGEGVVGGAEAVLAEMAHGLAARGWDTEILTTTATDHFTWEPVFPPGVVTTDDGVVVRRFPAVVSTDRSVRARLNAAIAARSHLRLDEQERWVNDDMRVPGLYHHLLDTAADYRALVFAPYLFWPAYACGQLAPERTVLMPCLHDEPEARLEIFRPLFTGSAGIWFLSEPERNLAQRLHPQLARHAVIGSGVRVPERYDVEGFRRRHGIDDRFVLFAGRREGGKNWETLLEMFAAACRDAGLPFRLVTIGHGRVRAPASVADRVVDLGYVPEHERDAAFAAADAYLQPSAYESFSRTMMEAWLAGTIVVATAESAVNRWHCERSQAGLLYDDVYEFTQCLRFVAEAPEAAAEIAAAGRGYVLAHYTWPPVLDAAEAAIDAWLGD